MMERIKTIILLVLVGLSFYLTYQLWGNEPGYEELEPILYESPIKIGEVRTWDDLFIPQEIVFHYPGDRHTKAVPGMVQYGMVWNAWRDWHIVDLQETDLERERWREILASRKGLEFRFRDALPLEMLQRLLDLPGNMPNGLKAVKRIWVYEEPGQNLHKVLLISDLEQKVLEGTVWDQEMAGTFHFDRLILFGEKLPPYQPVAYFGGDAAVPGYDSDFLYVYYLPKEPLVMNQWVYETALIPPREIAKALFLDTSALREIPARDGSIIITDGSKSLQTTANNFGMRYYIPALEKEKSFSAVEAFEQSVEFVNRHQGWTGTYLFSKWETQEDEQQVRFQELIHGYPVYGRFALEPLGEIRIKLLHKQVTEYHRPLFSFGKGTNQRKTVLAADALFKKLAQLKIPLRYVSHIELAYEGRLQGEDPLRMVMSPVYVVHFWTSREPIFIDAIAAEGGP